MARASANRRSAGRAAVPRSAAGRTPPSTTTVLVLAAAVVTAVWAVAMMTPGGRVAYVYLFAYAEFYLGVITLVALSVTVMTGLVATDRLVLSIRQRVLVQSAHRTAGAVAVAALLLHVGTKLVEGHVRAVDAVVPFLVPGYDRVYLGLGTIAGLLMIMVMWTGVARIRFAGRGRPGMWRAIHAVAYPMWPLAVIHGLSAGRPAAPWVVACYLLCVLGVLAGLVVRLSVRGERRGALPSLSGPMMPAGSMGPVGSIEPAEPATPPRVVARHAVDPAYVPPDDTPTLVDLAGRRARNEERRRAGGRGTARRARRPADDAAADIEYWRRLRREAR